MPPETAAPRRGRPVDPLVEPGAATTTRSGLKVRAALDNGAYPLGVKVSDRELVAVPMRRHDCTASGTTPCSLPPHNSTGTNLVARGPLNEHIAWAKSARTKALTISLSRPPNRAGAADPPRPRRRPGVACSSFPANSIVGHRRHRPERHVGQPPAAQRCGHHRNTIGT